MVIGDDVQASFESCAFVDNGQPLCREQDYTLVRPCCIAAPRVLVSESLPVFSLVLLREARAVRMNFWPWGQHRSDSSHEIKLLTKHQDADKHVLVASQGRGTSNMGLDDF